jgi:hypothetical protein
MAYVVLVHATFANQADAQHIYDQALAVATNASVEHIGDPTNERTSYALVGEEINGEVVVAQTWHIDLFGIVRNGQPVFDDAPPWIQPTGAQNAYPALNVRGEETRVTHNGQVWRNTHGDANTWEPGVFGWELIP